MKKRSKSPTQNQTKCCTCQGYIEAGVDRNRQSHYEVINTDIRIRSSYRTHREMKHRPGDGQRNEEKDFINSEEGVLKVSDIETDSDMKSKYVS